MNNITMTTATTIDIHLYLNAHVKLGCEQWAHSRHDEDGKESKTTRLPFVFQIRLVIAHGG